MTLKITFQKPSAQKILCLGVYEGNEFPPPTQAYDKELKGFLSQALSLTKKFGKLSQTLSVFTPTGRCIVLVGLGKKTEQNEKKWQKIGGSLAEVLNKVSTTGEAAVEIHTLGKHADTEVVSNLALGLLLRSWHFEVYFTKKSSDELFSLKKVVFLTPAPAEVEKAFLPLSQVAEGVFLTRTVVSEPGNVITPETLTKVAKSLEKQKVKVEVLGEKELKKLGMNAILGVGQGSAQESRLVVMRWEGGKKGEAPVAFVGKGVTFDTGGISIKPSARMEDMKYDMAGAGVVIGLMKALALRKAAVNVVGVVSLVENMPSGTAQRPGDVVKSLSGQTIEVVNTDAEGRLILADALWYTQDRFKPKAMIDLATLTGAMVVSLGSERAGLFASDQKLSKQLEEAGDKVDELLWPMPLDDGYDKDINSDIADMKNVGSGRGAGAITAAKFLQRFTNKTPWAHLDIAGVAWAEKALPVCAKGASGFGVRLLNQFVRDVYEGKK